MANEYVLRTRVQQKHDSAANWNQYNPQLKIAEIAFDLESGLFKVGNQNDSGELKRWDALPAYYLLTAEMKADIEKITSISEKVDKGQDWAQTDETAADYIKNKPVLKDIATSGLGTDVTVNVDLEGTGTSSDVNVEAAIADLAEKHHKVDKKKYTVTKQEVAEDGYFATYKLQLDGADIDGSAPINIPKDYLVKSADIKECETADTPVAGLKVGDKYIDFTVNTSAGTGTETHIYLSVQELVDAYTEGDGITISATNEVSVKLNADQANGITITAEGIGLALATSTSAGAMSATDKAKLDLVEAEANKYVHPTGDGNEHIPSGGTNGQLLTKDAEGNNVWADAPEGVASSTEENKITINEDKTMELNSANISKLVQTEGDYLVLDCGGAADC